MSSSVLQILLLMVSLTAQASGAAPELAKANCSETCGSVTIPFPFGIGAECFLDDWYEIACQEEVPILKKIGFQVLNISLPDGDVDAMIKVSLPVMYSNASCGGDGHVAAVSLEGSQFVFSQKKNFFTSVGCDTLATVNTMESAVFGCRTKCAGTNTSINRDSACSGTDGCCQTMLPLNLQGFSVDFKEKGGHQGCKYAFLRSDFTGSYDFRLNKTVPVVLEWGVASNTYYGPELFWQPQSSYWQLPSPYPSVCCTYRSDGSETPFMQCYCTRGHGGNPYLINGCKVQVSGATPGPPSHVCPEKCGNVTIPFPFGIGAGCFLDDWYQIACQEDNTIPVLIKNGVRILNISLPDADFDGMTNISLPVVYSNASCGGDGRGATVSLKGSQFVFSRTRNVFTSVGCNTLATVNSTESAFVGCRLKCAGANASKYSACSGRNGCCQARLPLNLQGFSVDFEEEEGGRQGCKYAFLRSGFTGVHDLSSSVTVPVVLEWGIANNTNYALDLFRQDYYSIYDSSYTTFTCDNYSVDNSEMLFTQCRCGRGYAGNPYVIGRCQDINECEDPSICLGTCVNKPGNYDCVDGRKTVKFIFIVLGASVGGLVQVLLLSRWLYTVIKKRREIKQKKKYFKTQWGLLWQQHLSSSPEGNVAKSKIFRFKDLEKATDRFHKDRILGRGGQGVVYKGMMTDGKIVAVKKSRLLDMEKVEEFINEVIILSQIDHRNVVKLMGCCLETDFPLLVYEFIPNGTLYQYLHDPNEDLLSSWDTHLRIATEIAGALFYLHSAASIPIYHRDIKSTNILLDEKYRAKVADFGISKSVSLDETHVTTLVRGTFGYLDPEYFRTGHFTDKSDVYSFGVVLDELLTGQMPICRVREEEERSLAAYFVISMEQNCLFDVADARVMEEGKKEEIAAVANLARRCLSSIGRNRPTMREVAMELEGIRKLQSSSSFQRNQGQIEPAESRDSRFASGKSFVDTGVTTFSDVQPLVHWESW